MKSLSVLVNLALLLTVSLFSRKCTAFSPISRPVCRLSVEKKVSTASPTKLLHEGSGTRTWRNQKRQEVIALATTALSEEEADGDEDQKGTTKVGIRKRISSYFKGNKEDDGMTFRQRLGKMGLATVLSYGWISNVNGMALSAVAWYVFSVKTKMSPLWPGQWKPFLSVYAGFYVISNLMRPFRVTLAVAVSPYFDRLVEWFQRKTNMPKAAAVTATVLLVNLGGTTLLFIGGISLASLLSGVAVFPPKGL